MWCSCLRGAAGCPCAVRACGTERAHVSDRHELLARGAGDVFWRHRCLAKFHTCLREQAPRGQAGARRRRAIRRTRHVLFAARIRRGRVAATPRRRRGYSVESSRGDTAVPKQKTKTKKKFRTESRRRRGCSVEASLEGYESWQRTAKSPPASYAVGTPTATSPAAACGAAAASTGLCAAASATAVAARAAGPKRCGCRIGARVERPWGTPHH